MCSAWISLCPYCNPIPNQTDSAKLTLTKVGPIYPGVGQGDRVSARVKVTRKVLERVVLLACMLEDTTTPRFTIVLLRGTLVQDD